MNWRQLALQEEIPAQSCKIFLIEGVVLAIAHTSEGYFAFEDACTHDGGPLAMGCLSGNEIICPRHGARFDVRDGRVLSAPAYEDLKTYPVKIAEGYIWVATDW